MYQPTLSSRHVSALLTSRQCEAGRLMSISTCSHSSSIPAAGAASTARLRLMHIQSMQLFWPGLITPMFCIHTARTHCISDVGHRDITRRHAINCRQETVLKQVQPGTVGTDDQSACSTELTCSSLSTIFMLVSSQALASITPLSIRSHSSRPAYRV